MQRVPWQRDRFPAQDQPDFDLPLRDGEPEPGRERQPERPLLVWPQDDTPRMGRAAGAVYLAFLVLLAFGAVWVIERDVEGPAPVAESRAPEQLPALEPPRPDVTGAAPAGAPGAVPDLDDVAATEIDPAVPIDRPTVDRPTADRPEVAATQPEAPQAPPARPPFPAPVRPPLAVTPAPAPPRRAIPETIPSPPPTRASVEPPLVPASPRVAPPEPTPPPRAPTTEPASSPPGAAVPAEPVTLPRVAVVDPELVPPATPPSTTTSSPPAPNTPAPPAAAAPSSNTSRVTRVDESGAIRDVLGRYRSAFNTLDSKAARQVWPSVDQRTLDKAFGQLQEQSVSFDRCTIDVKGVLAEASCSGTTRFVPRVGSRSPQVEPRQWSFSLRKAYDGGWQIQEVQAR